MTPSISECGTESVIIVFSTVVLRSLCDDEAQAVLDRAPLVEVSNGGRKGHVLVVSSHFKCHRKRWSFLNTVKEQTMTFGGRDVFRSVDDISNIAWSLKRQM